jgi:hypothetical protein
MSASVVCGQSAAMAAGAPRSAARRIAIAAASLMTPP